MQVNVSSLKHPVRSTNKGCVKQVIFKILSISHGWFKMAIDWHFILDDSKTTGADAPALLLDALKSIVECKSVEEWICWDYESGAYIQRLEKAADQLIMEIYSPAKDYRSYSHLHSGTDLEKHISECLYKTTVRLADAVESICSEFELYENGNGRQRYDHHWMDFPEQSYHRLKNAKKLSQ